MLRPDFLATAHYMSGVFESLITIIFCSICGIPCGFMAYVGLMMLDLRHILSGSNILGGFILFIFGYATWCGLAAIFLEAIPKIFSKPQRWNDGHPPGQEFTTEDILRKEGML